MNNPRSRSVALTNIGIAMARLGDVKNGIAKVKQAVAIAESNDAKEHVIGMTLELVNIYEAAHRYEEALASMRKAAALSDEYTGQERKQAVLGLQEKYSAERKTREIERLSLQTARQSAEASARVWQQRLWAAAAIALGLAAALLVLILKRSRTYQKRLKADNAALSETSMVDALTGAFNRRQCHALMSRQQAPLESRSRDRDYKPFVGLMMIDVDHFKNINDTHGHAAGDMVLVELARRLHHLVREQDALIRWGGEEFVLMLPGTPAQGLEVLAERLLRTVAVEPMDLGGGKLVRVTVSLGCVAFPLFPDQHWEDALNVADMALYMAKAQGRNRGICLVDVAPDANLDTLRSDLAAAEAAGQVTLHTCLGPEAVVEHRRLA